MKVHVVDGTYELFRAFYGAPAVPGEGLEIGASLALMRSLQALANQPDVTHLAVAFDHVIESFRNELFDGYKTGAGIDPQLLRQFPIAEEATRALGIAVWPMVEFEADDALASAAALYGADPEVDQLVICSPDKDLMQCVVGERVVCLDRMRRRLYDEPEVEQKFGVPPRLIPDYLALVGDSADGIPGVSRWGAKSAAALLSRYDGLDKIPLHDSEWDIKVRGAPALAASLRGSLEDALLYRKLATLRRDVPLKETTEDLRWRGVNAERLEQFGALHNASGPLARYLPAAH